MKLTMGDGSPVIASELPWVLAFHGWVCLLGAPNAYQSLKRAPPKEHLNHIFDAVKPYIQGERYYSQRCENQAPPDPTRRGRLFDRLCELITALQLPGLTDDIVCAARALFEEESGGPPDGGWDAWEQSARNISDSLIWPEQIPELIAAAENAEADFDRAARHILQGGEGG